MKKIALSLICLLSLFLVSPAQVRAKEVQVAYVNYTGHGKNLTTSRDLFNNFKNVFPGDKLKDALKLKNKTKNTIKVYVKALAGDEATKKFLDKSPLQIEGIGEVGKLSSRTFLAKIPKGAEKNIGMSLDIPTSLGNEFQGKSLSVKWELDVEEYNDEGQLIPDTSVSSLPLALALFALIVSAYFIKNINSRIAK